LIHRNQKDLNFFQFEHLSACSGVWHGIFTRHRGHSQDSFRSLNVSFGVGDDKKAVIRNRHVIARCIGTKNLVFTRQVHGTQIVPIDAACISASDWSSDSQPTGDAMITNLQDTYLVLQVADCQPVLLVDPIRRVVANVHAGWRGSIANILGVTVNLMKTRYGCSTDDIFAGIGPSLGPCCAEFIHYKKEIPFRYWKYKNSADHFDFWAMSRDQLCESGLLPDHISSSNLCTRCRTDLFYSYRGEGITGRFAAVVGLTPEKK